MTTAAVTADTEADAAEAGVALAAGAVDTADHAK